VGPKTLEAAIRGIYADLDITRFADTIGLPAADSFGSSGGLGR
jgi:hypothetical protein